MAGATASTAGSTGLRRSMQARVEGTKEFFDDQTTAESDGYDVTLPIMGSVKMIGGAIITIAVIVLVLNEVFAVGSLNNSSGPFGGVLSDLKTTGAAALGLLVVGLLVVAATVIMSFFGDGF